MLETGIRGSWSKGTRTNLVTPLHGPLDPAHADPDVETPDIDRDTTGPAPTLPFEIVEGQYLQPPVAGGPLDMTPMDHGVGVGVQPGVSLDLSREIGLIAHETDLGATDARLTTPQVGEYIGKYTVREVITDPGNGDSTGYPTERYDSGVGTPNDPFARRSFRLNRITEAEIDWHRWGVEYRPRFVRNARGSMQYAPVPNGAPWVSPFGAGGVEYSDSYQPSQERRAPRGWDEQDTVDVVGLPTAADFGLTTWGL